MSDYFKKLEAEHPDVAVRYNDKIKIINGTDPYLITKQELQFSKDAFPAIHSLDIITYLVLTHSFYTSQQMKAFKSLSAYKYFEAGFVRDLGVTDINGFKVIVCKVKHSMRTSLPPVDMWIICKADGSVVTAHCTCMAGAAEVCSHVGAALYALEFIHQEAQSTSCTDVQAAWKIPRLDAGAVRSLKEVTELSSKPSSSTIAPPSSDQLCDLLHKIKSRGGECAIMRVIEPFASEIADNLKTEELPATYTSLYSTDNDSLSLSDLQEVGKNLSFNMTDDDSLKIFEATLQQSSCAAWYTHRTGRVTASKFARVCKTKIERPSISIIKAICYPLKCTFRSKATSWGIQNEKKAMEKYRMVQQKQHQGFKCYGSGLIIDPNLPQFAASPDGMCQCECCGKGCVEIKCPYLLKSMTMAQYIELKYSCLERIDNKTKLKRSHDYYYQVQLQIKLSDTAYCDFVVWSQKDFYVERIYACEEFWQSNYKKAKQFHESVIMPELLGKFFTRNTATTDLWCLCKTNDDGRPMIECGNVDCEIKWFHMECVTLSSVPEILWLCEHCK